MENMKFGHRPYYITITLLLHYFYTTFGKTKKHGHCDDHSEPQHATMNVHLTWWVLVVLHASQQLGTCRPAYCWAAAFNSALVTHNFEISGLRMAEG
jgi:hypothetical protein